MCVRVLLVARVRGCSRKHDDAEAFGSTAEIGRMRPINLIDHFKKYIPKVCERGWRPLFGVVESLVSFESRPSQAGAMAATTQVRAANVEIRNCWNKSRIRNFVMNGTNAYSNRSSGTHSDNRHLDIGT